MKKVLLLLIIFLNVNYVVYAEDFRSHDVSAKVDFYYNYESVLLNFNSTVKITLDDYKFNINSSSSNDNNIKMVIIPVNINNYSSMIGNDDTSNINLYYVGFYDKSDNKKSLSGSVDISILDNNKGLKNATVKYYSYSKNELLKKNFVSGSEKININNEGYLYINSGLNIINFTSNNGSIYIDGYKIGSSYNTFDTNIDLIINPNEGYEVSKITFNNSVVNSSNGFLSLDLEKNNTLVIDYKKIDVTSDNTFRLKGNVNASNYDNLKLVMHNPDKSYNVNSDGSFSLDNINFGKHTLSLYRSDELVGFYEFNINDTDNKDVSYSSGNIDTYKNTAIIKMNIKLNGDRTEDFLDITSYRRADVNLDSKVNINDLVLLRKYLVQLTSFDDDSSLTSDVNSDKKININDVIKIRKYLVGMESL